MQNICKAMAEAFPEIEGAVKDKNNPFFKSKYADLATVIAAIKPALAKHGLWFVQKVHNEPGSGTVGVETVIMHMSGESLSCGTLIVPVSKQDCQGYGSALTYCRRYSLSAAFGVAQEDDDANSACGLDKKTEQMPVKKLTSGEIAKLAGETVEILGLDIGIHLTSVIAFIDACEAKRPNLRQYVETLRKNPDEFARLYAMFMQSGKAKEVDQKVG